MLQFRVARDAMAPSRAMRRASSGSLVIAMPPSPVVMILTGWKLKTVMSL